MKRKEWNLEKQAVERYTYKIISCHTDSLKENVQMHVRSNAIEFFVVVMKYRNQKSLGM